MPNAPRRKLNIEEYNVSESDMIESARIYLDKIILADVWSTFFGIAGQLIAMSESRMYYYQVRYNLEDEDGNIQYEDQYEDSEITINKFLRIIATASCMVTIITVWAAYSYERKYLIYKNEVRPNTSYYELGWLRTMIIEFIILSIHCPPTINARIKLSQHNQYIVFNQDQILTTLMQLRVYLLLRLAGKYSRFYSDDVFGLCRKNYIPMTLMFALKCLLKEYPYSLSGLSMLVSILVLGFTLSAYEQPFQYSSGQNWDSLVTGFWCCIITMSTVGYGDYYPVTHFGRFIAVVAMIWGQFLISLILIGMVITASFTTQEEKAFNSIKISEFIYDMAKHSIVVLQHWWLGRMLRKGKTPRRFLKMGPIKATRQTDLSFRLAMNEFNLMRKSYVSTVNKEDVDLMIHDLNTKIHNETGNLKVWDYYGSSIMHQVGELERSVELNLERADWILQEWINRYKDLGFRLQILCHLRPSLKFAAQRSWREPNDKQFDANPTIFKKFDVVDACYKHMTGFLGKERQFVGLSLHNPPKYITEKQYNNQIENTSIIEDTEDLQGGVGKLMSNGKKMDSVQNSGNDKHSVQNSNTKMNFGGNVNSVLGNAKNGKTANDAINRVVENIIQNDKKHQYQTGNALKYLSKAMDTDKIGEQDKIGKAQANENADNIKQMMSTNIYKESDGNYGNKDVENLMKLVDDSSGGKKATKANLQTDKRLVKKDSTNVDEVSDSGSEDRGKKVKKTKKKKLKKKNKQLMDNIEEDSEAIGDPQLKKKKTKKEKVSTGFEADIKNRTLASSLTPTNPSK